MSEDLKPIDWTKPFYGDPEPQSCICLTTPTTLAYSMTVLAGSYMSNASDVFLISDRRSTPCNADGVSPVQNSRKTLRLGDNCAIGFSGAVPLHSAVLAKLLGVVQPPQHVDLLSALAENDERFSIPCDDVVNTLNWLTASIVGRMAPPKGKTMTILLAGRMAGDIPVLAQCTAETGWQFRPALGGYVSSPVRERDVCIREKLQAIIDAPDSSPIQSMKAAIAFCADRYDTVNRHYTLRRLSNGFRREEGIV